MQARCLSLQAIKESTRCRAEFECHTPRANKAPVEARYRTSSELCDDSFGPEGNGFTMSRESVAGTL